MPLSFPLWGRSRRSGPPDWLVVGLGNPGAKYADTRHNVGFHILDRLAEAENLQFDETRNKALLSRGQLADVPVALVKPQTFMNLSGQAVGGIARFYKVSPEKILVIYDDLDLPPGKMRLRLKGGSGGHKGMTSIIQHLGSQDFPRIRIGIGRPPGQMLVEAYVLQKFNRDEWEFMEQTYHDALAAIRASLQHGVEYAMNNFN